MNSGLVQDPWERLRPLTPARIALGRTGHSLPTRECLNLALAHARARDAVHLALDVSDIEQACQALGFGTARVRSAAPDRATYLRRPDLGRKLHADDATRLASIDVKVDLVFVVADGLSSPAAQTHAPRILEALKPYLDKSQFVVAPVIVAEQARVALGDEIGSLLRARMTIMLIGERPGLSSPDSLGIYLTLAPAIGCTDAARNCISNIRPGGLDYATAARRLFWLIEEAFRLGKSGVALKDASDLLLAADNHATLPMP